MQSAAATVLAAVEEHEVPPVEGGHDLPGGTEVVEVELLELAAPAVAGHQEHVEAVHTVLVEHQQVASAVDTRDLIPRDVDIAARRVSGAPALRRR